jgi:hypothetical protein
MKVLLIRLLLVFGLTLGVLDSIIRDNVSCQAKYTSVFLITILISILDVNLPIVRVHMCKENHI